MAASSTDDFSSELEELRDDLPAAVDGAIERMRVSRTPLDEGSGPGTDFKIRSTRRRGSSQGPAIPTAAVVAVSRG